MSNWIGEPQRMIVCAAMRYPSGFILCSPRHVDSIVHDFIRNHPLAAISGKGAKKVEQGFVDQRGVFLNRKEALIVAQAAGQINVRRTKTNPVDELFSEDLY